MQLIGIAIDQRHRIAAAAVAASRIAVLKPVAGLNNIDMAFWATFSLKANGNRETHLMKVAHRVRPARFNIRDISLAICG